MSFNWQTFRTRTLTAIVFVAVMLAGLLWNPWSFLLLFSVIHMGCWWEYLKLVEKIHTTSFHIYYKLGWIVTGFGILLWFCDTPVFVIKNYSIRDNLSLPVSAAGFALLIIGIFQKNKITPGSFLASLAGLLYFSLSCGLMMDLYHFKANLHGVDNFPQKTDIAIIPILIIACLWINDTMAYIVGSLIGKRPLSKISPKKTWEGTIGGILLAVLVVFFLTSSITAIPGNPDPVSSALLALLVSVIGTIGDLFESKLKRMANVKDSGTIMPGHGGFLDRFDSLLFAIPFTWIWLHVW